MSNGCPVAPLNALQVDAQLGLISVGNVDASFVRSLVAFNTVHLEDDESLQQGQHIHGRYARQALRGLLAVGSDQRRRAFPRQAAQRWSCVSCGMDVARAGLKRCTLSCWPIPLTRANGMCSGTYLWNHITSTESDTSCWESMSRKSTPRRLSRMIKRGPP